MPRLFARTPLFLLTLVLSASWLGLLLASPGQGRPRPRPEGRISDPAAGPLAEPDRPHAGPLLHSVPAGPGAGLLAAGDTIYYGGTVWAADSNRWEALRGGTWTFDSGIGSSLVTVPGGCKAVGYHRTMEGWSEVLSSSLIVTSGWRRGPECAIHQARSMHLGWSQPAADSLCYAAGAGYGTNWNEVLAKSFSYPGGGDVTLSFDYRVDAEPSFDYLRVYLDPTGTSTPASGALLLTSYTGAVSGHDTIVLQRGVELPTGAGPIRILFEGFSDGGYDDQDGFYPSACGLATLDDITLSGALVDVTTFETSANGWLAVPHPCDPGGTWADLRHLSTLPPTAGCGTQCAMADSVLLFADPGGGHPLDADEFAGSPWIDLKAGGDLGLTGRFMQFDGYFDLPLQGNVFVQTYVQYYPWRCASTGKEMTSPWISSQALQNFGGAPNCARTGRPIRLDLGALIPADAEQVRIGVGIVNYCRLHPECTGLTNSTPWFDNFRFGVYGRAPQLTLQTRDALSDAFATDGTLNPASPARVDASSRPGLDRAPGDSLVCSGDGGNQEVRINFRVRPGPFLNGAALAAWAAARWTPNPAAGPGWWSARMDTTEMDGAVVPGAWMTTLHESDPRFGGGTDRERGGDGDASQLTHDIFPDHLLTPGSRIDYFISARFLPPDPRNPGGASLSVLPDTTEGHFLELEVLPSSMTADTTWNCVLYANSYSGETGSLHRAAEQAGLNSALGPGGTTPEGTRFDRCDLSEGFNGLSLGRGPGRADGASSAQLAAYGVVVSSALLGDADVGVLTPWLADSSPAHPRRLWLSGSATTSLNGSAARRAFRSDVLGVSSGTTYLDQTNCAPLSTAAGAHFANGGPLDLTSQTCPLGEVLGSINPALAASVRLQTTSHGVSRHVAFSRLVAGTDARTLLDGFRLADLRTGGSGCPVTPDAGPATRARDVLRWFGWPNGGFCTPGGVSDVPPPDAAAPPGRLELSTVTTPTAGGGWRIAFALPARGAVTLRLYDVAGRVVRTLLDQAPLDAGAQETTWDGRSARGERVAAGLYFLRLASDGEARTRKLVVRE